MRLLALFLCLTTAALGQTFDTVSIHPNHSGKLTGSLSMPLDGDRFTASNAPLRRIIAFAYNFRRDDLVLGAPDWTRTERFDILAKIAGPDLPCYQRLTLEQQRALLRPILADRFHLQASLETRRQPAYALIVSKKLLKPTLHSPARVTGPDGKPTTEDDFITAPGHFVAHAISMSSLALALSNTPGTDRQVFDHTGLVTTYDFTLNWATTPTADSDLPSLPTALAEQLGLKLVPISAEIDVLVIKSVEHPTPN